MFRVFTTSLLKTGVAAVDSVSFVTETVVITTLSTDGGCESRKLGPPYYFLNEGILHMTWEIILNILSRLPAESVLIFQSMCKTWYGMEHDLSFPNLQLSRTNRQQLQLMILSAAQRSIFWINILSWRVKEMPFNLMESPKLKFTGSCDGLKCVAESIELDPVYVCNPVTREFIPLPKSGVPETIWYQHIEIGFDPSSERYKVIRTYIGDLEEVNITFEILTPRESSWRKLRFPRNFALYGSRHF
ncbi:F-box domain [Dillenia turbinata]|uniref:F-box domain n=1 Tax=Dillenia turbinata TaxID=194707 RepID=A0AAN8V0C2_9MAGN